MSSPAAAVAPQSTASETANSPETTNTTAAPDAAPMPGRSKITVIVLKNIKTL